MSVVWIYAAQTNKQNMSYPGLEWNEGYNLIEQPHTSITLFKIYILSF